MKRDFGIFHGVRQAALALLVLSAVVGHASSETTRSSEPSFESLRAWPIVDVRRWPGYEDIETVAPQPPAGGAPAPAISEVEKQARLQSAAALWENARGQAHQALTLARPDLLPLLDNVEFIADYLPSAVIVVHGAADQPPHLSMHFTITDGTPRLVYLQLYAQKNGDEPDPDNAAVWQSRAEAMMEPTFGYRPADISSKPVVRAELNSLYLDWRPHWRGVEFPIAYWTRFGAARHGETWVHAWTAPASPQQVLEARDNLSALTVNVGINQAAMTAVKNLAQLAPTMIDDDARVWAEMTLTTPGVDADPNARTLYLDPAAVTRQQTRGPIAPVWRVRVVLSVDALRSAYAWVDAVDGSLFQVTVDGPRHD